MVERRVRRAAPPEKVIAYLDRRGGSIAAPDGRGLTARIARAIRCQNPNNVLITLRLLEAQGIVAREARGRRTFRISLVDHGRSTRARGSSPLAPSPPATLRERDKPRRQRIIEYLADNGGEVESSDGRGLRVPMAKAVGYRDVRTLNVMLRRLAREGVVVQDSWAGRTYRIALAEPPPARRRRTLGP